MGTLTTDFNMAYTENIPLATTNPSQDQELIKDNFNAIFEVFNINHKGFNDAAKGKHTAIQMQKQTLVPTTSVDEMALYTKKSTRTLKTEMFIRKEDSGTEIEFTSSLKAINGWMRLPSGILLKWGTGSGSGSHTINFPTAPTIPVFVATFTGFVVTKDTSASPNTFATFRSTSNTAISVFGSKRTSAAATTTTYNYLVMGS